MAEFGENLKRLREEKGMTQQILADSVYVTRQAVSRWEGGSRYPDLMTAKKLSVIMGTTLDALLEGDSLASYPQKAPVLESSVARRAEAAIFAFGFIAYGIMALWRLPALATLFTGNVESEPVWIIGFLGAALPTLLAVALGCGLVRSVLNRVDPGFVAKLAATYFGGRAANQLVVSFQGPMSWLDRCPVLAIALLLLTLAVVVAAYFRCEGKRSPKLLYAALAGYGAIHLAARLYSLLSVMNAGQEEIAMIYLFPRTIVEVIADTALLGLIAFMARELRRKRNRAAL